MLRKCYYTPVQAAEVVEMKWDTDDDDKSNDENENWNYQVSQNYPSPQTYE